MAITLRPKIKYQIDDEMRISVITINEIMDNDKVIGETQPHRRLILPGAEVSQEVQKTKDLAGLLHTTSEVAKFRARHIND